MPKAKPTSATTSGGPRVGLRHERTRPAYHLWFHGRSGRTQGGWGLGFAVVLGSARHFSQFGAGSYAGVPNSPSLRIIRRVWCAQCIFFLNRRGKRVPNQGTHRIFVLFLRSFPCSGYLGIRSAFVRISTNPQRWGGESGLLAHLGYPGGPWTPSFSSIFCTPFWPGSGSAKVGAHASVCRICFVSFFINCVLGVLGVLAVFFLEGSFEDRGGEKYVSTSFFLPPGRPGNRPRTVS